MKGCKNAVNNKLWQERGHLCKMSKPIAKKCESDCLGRYKATNCVTINRMSNVELCLYVINILKH